MNKRIFATISLMLALAGASALAGSPDFKAFNTNQFSTTTSAVAVKPLALVTNIIVSSSGDGTVPLVVSNFNFNFSQEWFGNGGGHAWLDRLCNFVTLGTVTATGGFFGDGTGVTNLNATNLTGVLAITNGGTAASTAKGAATNVGFYPISNPRFGVFAGGGDPFVDAKNSLPSYIGQMGWSSFSNTVVYPWVANALVTNTGWVTPPWVLVGGLQVGHNFNMPDNGGNADMQWIFNGNPANQTQAFAALHGDAQFEIRNNNPWSSGSFAVFDSVTTNSASVITVLSTNSDGIPIYEDEFGALAVGISPGQAAEVNLPTFGMAIENGFRPYAIATSTTVGGTAAWYSWMQTDPTNHLLRFPKWIAGKVSPKSAGWLDVLTLNNSTGDAALATNGTLTVSNVTSRATQAGAYLFGNQAGADSSAMFNVNGSFVASGATAFDNSSHRLGFVPKSGNYEKFEHGAGTPLTFAQSSDSDLLANPASAAQTNEMVITTTSDVCFGYQITGFQPWNTALVGTTNYSANAAGSDLKLSGGYSTGSGAGGSIVFGVTSSAVALSTVANTPVTAAWIDGKSGNLVVTNALLGPGSIALTNKSATQAATLVLTNSTGGPIRVWVALDAEVTTSATGSLAVQFTATNLSSGQYTWTPSSINTASTGYTPFAPQVFVLSNNTSLTYTATLTGTGHYNLNANVLRWQ